MGCESFNMKRIVDCFKRWSKTTSKSVLAALVFALLITLACSVPLYFYCLGSNEVSIVAIGEKNADSNAYKVWITRILVDGREMDLTKLTNGPFDAWVYSEDNAAL